MGSSDTPGRPSTREAGSGTILVKYVIDCMAKYSETLTEQVTTPRNGGVKDAELTGHAGSPGRGAFIILFLKVEGGRIAAAKYHTVGCGPTIASGSILTEIIQGRTIKECRKLTAQDLIDALDGVPPDKLHCPALAIGALKDALAKWPDPQMATK